MTFSYKGVLLYFVRFFFYFSRNQHPTLYRNEIATPQYFKQKLEYKDD